MSNSESSENEQEKKEMLLSWNKTPIDPNDWQVEILTQFPNHVDPLKRSDWLPIGFAKNPNKTEEVELLIKIPPTKRQFKIRIKYIGVKTYDADDSETSWRAYFNGIYGGKKFAKFKPGCERIIETFKSNLDVEYPMMFDVVNGGSSSDGSNDQVSNNFGIRLSARKFCTVSSKKVLVTRETSRDIKTEPGIKHQDNSENPVFGGMALVTDSQSKLVGGRVSLGAPIERVEMKPLLNESQYETKYTLKVFDESSVAFTIRFCNHVNLLQWCKNKWGEGDIKDLYHPFDYEEDEDPVLRNLPSLSNPSSSRVTESEVIDLENECKVTNKRSIEPIDLDDDQPLKIKKIPFYRHWNVSVVSKWLKRIDAQWERLGYDSLFEKHEIDGACLEEMSHQALSVIGIVIGGHQLKILMAIKELDMEDS